MQETYILEVPYFSKREKGMIAKILTEIKNLEEKEHKKIDNNKAISWEIKTKSDWTSLLLKSIRFENFEHYCFMRLFEAVMPDKEKGTTTIVLSPNARPLLCLLGVIEGEEKWANNL